MQTGPPTHRSLSRLRSARLPVAAMLLPALLLPAPAYAGTSVAITVCSSEGERTITIPARESPPPGPDDRQGCAHFVCPRERAQGGAADEDEE